MASKKFKIRSNNITSSFDDRSPEESLMERRLSESDSSASSLNSPHLGSSTVSSRSSISTIHPRTLQVSLPSSWYTSENFFALETRAIFSQVCPHLSCEDRLHGAGMALCHSQQSIPRGGDVFPLLCRDIPNLSYTFQRQDYTGLSQYLPPSWLPRGI